MHVDARGSMDSGRGVGSASSSINGGNRERFSPHYHGNSSHHSNSNNSINNNNHQSSSPSYDNGIKSDSPSRKRRRVSSRIPSQSPPSSWEQQHQSPRNQQNPQQHGGQMQNSQLLRRQHQNAPTLMVEMNQVPVSLPLRHEPIWTYSAGPHISISSLCTNHPPPTQHLPQCQVHGVYSQPFAQNCGIGGHYGGFPSQPAQLQPMQAQTHQAPPHYQHSHMQAVSDWDSWIRN